MLKFTLNSCIRASKLRCQIRNMSLEVKIIPVLKDNYSYLLVDKVTKQGCFVDPVEPKKVLEAFEKEYPDYTLKSILTTHHHWDHAGGNEALKGLKPEIEVIGGDKQIKALETQVVDGQKLKLGELDILCLKTTGHTSNHICYYVTDKDDNKVVFTGDTLFVGGCGRFFEGTPKDMYHSLIEKLAELPKDTKVFCGHEYTSSNYKFALSVDPENLHLKAKNDEIKLKKISIPSTIEQELLTNPFMRVNELDLQTKFNLIKDPVGLMGKLRELKDKF